MFDVIDIGLSLGCVYALVAIGFTLIYATTGVINFGQGTFVMLAGVVAATTVNQWHMPMPLALVAGVGAAVLSGEFLALCIVIPLWKRGASEFTTILGTLMFLVIGENSVLNIIGSNPLSVPALTPNVHFKVLGTDVSSQTLWVILAVVCLSVGLMVFLKWRPVGVAMRACSVDKTNSRLLGISPSRIAIVAFTLSALIGGIGGVLIAPLQFTSYGIAGAYSIKGFLAAVVGGLGNIRGAVIGGLLVGFFEAIVATYVSSSYLNLFVLAALVIVLLVRPSGIFGAVSTL